MKYLSEGAFTVLGEGSAESMKKYRDNYERIFGKPKPKPKSEASKPAEVEAK